MKFGKIIAILMASLLCATAFISCDNKEEDTEKLAVYYTVTFNIPTSTGMVTPALRIASIQRRN